MDKHVVLNQDILTGSSRLVRDKKSVFDRNKFFLDNMNLNKAYKYYLEKNEILDKDNKILNEFKSSFKKYRLDWKNYPKTIYSNKNEFEQIKNNIQGPLCLDIEIAAVCDLACPHCFREYILTPDKIMKFDTFKAIINSAVKMKVPSIKLNWRGEPLLHSKIGDFIDYAKKNGIIEVAINTNGTHLSEKMGLDLIKSGLDLIIYSFDGGTKETYEKMRPGRFEKNKFENVYQNIKNFNKLKKKLNAKFPITKIQMVLTEDTRLEIDSFFNLFIDIVDDVTVTPYTERGGRLEDLTFEQKKKIENYAKINHLKSEDINYCVEIDKDIQVAVGRKPCEQLFQRLMVTYDGRVAMCCHDWGAQHCLGYVDNLAFEIGETLDILEKSIKNNKKGFELLKNAKRPKIYNQPPNYVQSLEEIWKGEELNKVRNFHKNDEVDSVEICKKCSFKDTYVWKKIE
jgi:MoaA/NifB/PqqE/SkfB family radical SAM enzyme